MGLCCLVLVQQKSNYVDVDQFPASSTEQNPNIYIRGSLLGNDVKRTEVFPGAMNNFTNSLEMGRIGDSNVLVTHAFAAALQVAQHSDLSGNLKNREALQNDAPFAQNPHTMVKRRTVAMSM